MSDESDRQRLLEQCQAIDDLLVHVLSQPEGLDRRRAARFLVDAQLLHLSSDHYRRDERAAVEVAT